MFFKFFKNILVFCWFTNDTFSPQCFIFQNCSTSLIDGISQCLANPKALWCQFYTGLKQHLPFQSPVSLVCQRITTQFSWHSYKQPCYSHKTEEWSHHSMAKLAGNHQSCFNVWTNMLLLNLCWIQSSWRLNPGIYRFMVVYLVLLSWGHCQTCSLKHSLEQFLLH